MDFETALRTELISIDELQLRVFPIYAVESANTPFLTYYKEDVNYEMTLDGMTNLVNGTYGIDILHTSYKELQQLFKLVKSKLQSFLQRNIGKEDGPYIQFVQIERVRDLYEDELDCFRLNFILNVKFKEV